MGGATTHAPKRVSWIELFFDLVFVAAVGQVGRPLAEASGPGVLLQYVFLLVLIWWAWHGYAAYATRFDPDARSARAFTLLQMVAVVFMAANAEDHLASESTAGFVAAYGAMRVLLAMQYSRTPTVDASRPLVRLMTRGLLAGGVAWILSALLPVPWRYAGWGVAALADGALERAARRRVVLTPPHAHHLPERFGLFTLILLGEALVSIMRGIQQQPVWSLPAVTAVALGLTVVGLVWWAYFDVACATAPRPVVTMREARAHANWTYAHLPLYLGVALLGVEVEHLIRDGGHAPADVWRLVQGIGSLVVVTAALLLLWRHGTAPRAGAAC